MQSQLMEWFMVLYQHTLDGQFMDLKISLQADQSLIQKLFVNQKECILGIWEGKMNFWKGF